MDLLSGGDPDRPRGGRGAALFRHRAARAAAMVAGVAVVAVLALRGTGPAGSADRPVGGPTRAAPAATDLPAVEPAPAPPFDRLPGRTPIPDPTRAGWGLHGRLPAVGGPDKPAAVRAAGLVLGRFCAEPAAYTLTAGPEPDWRRVSVLVFALDRSGDPPRIQLWLHWRAGAYDWAGTPLQLAGC